MKIKEFINKEYKFDKVTLSAMLAATFVFSAIYGWLYELIFYYINGGGKQWYWRGACFGPWILIYGIGSLVIYFVTKKFKSKPWAVFLVGALSSGVVEGVAGALIYYIGHKRNWDYNTEIWNWGNIGGFVCLRSVLVFAISSIMLVYLIIPLISLIADKANKKVFCSISFTLFGIYCIDMIYNYALVKLIPSLLSANEFYQSLGFAIMKFN
ncbi:MAG: putative ABC transporter permease [Clostridia bacterium]|nr:putative ABC transporter permease [Clostridia bacterium]